MDEEKKQELVKKVIQLGRREDKTEEENLTEFEVRNEIEEFLKENDIDFKLPEKGNINRIKDKIQHFIVYGRK